jgi:hypothetical protein
MKYIKYMILTISLTFFLTGCNEDYNIKYYDGEMSNKLNEIYKNELNELNFIIENYIQISEKNFKDSFDYIDNNKSYINKILINYKSLREIYDFKLFINKECKISYKYNVGLFSDNFIFIKEEVIKYGRKKYFAIIKECVKNDLNLILENKYKFNSNFNENEEELLKLNERI